MNAAEKRTDKPLQPSENAEKYRELAENIAEGIYMTRNGFIEMVNTPLANMFGYKPEEVIGKKVWDFVKPECRDKVRKLFMHKFRHSDTSPVEVECQKKDGTAFWAVIRMSIIESEYKVYGVISDITLQKNAELLMMESEKRLRELNAAKDKLFSIIAHDLKSPYNAQLGLLELLLDEDARFEKNDRQRFIAMIYDSAKKSFALLDNLLLWSRIQTGNIQANPKTFWSNEFIDENLRNWQNAAFSKEIELRSDFLQPDREVVADPDMLNTIMGNLIANAIKFSYPGSKVNIGARFFNEHFVGFYVADSGTGIPSQHIEKLFRADENYTTRGTANEKGTGLGLIICNDLVAKNGGKIWLDSKEGIGTTCWFTLPVINNQTDALTRTLIKQG